MCTNERCVHVCVILRLFKDLITSHSLSKYLKLILFVSFLYFPLLLYFFYTFTHIYLSIFMKIALSFLSLSITHQVVCPWGRQPVQHPFHPLTMLGKRLCATQEYHKVSIHPSIRFTLQLNIYTTASHSLTFHR